MKLFEITFPVKKIEQSYYYPLIITDANDIIHYWNHDGNYDGFSHDPCIDGKTKINMN